VGTWRAPVFTPDDVRTAALIEGPVVVYDLTTLHGSALRNTLPGSAASVRNARGACIGLAIMSNEQPQIHRALFRAGIACTRCHA